MFISGLIFRSLTFSPSKVLKHCNTSVIKRTFAVNIKIYSTCDKNKSCAMRLALKNSQQIFLCLKKPIFTQPDIRFDILLLAIIKKNLFQIVIKIWRHKVHVITHTAKLLKLIACRFSYSSKTSNSLIITRVREYFHSSEQLRINNIASEHQAFDFSFSWFKFRNTEKYRRTFLS